MAAPERSCPLAFKSTNTAISSAPMGSSAPLHRALHPCRHLGAQFPPGPLNPTPERGQEPSSSSARVCDTPPPPQGTHRCRPRACSLPLRPGLSWILLSQTIISICLSAVQYVIHNYVSTGHQAYLLIYFSPWIFSGYSQEILVMTLSEHQGSSFFHSDQCLYYHCCFQRKDVSCNWTKDTTKSESSSFSSLHPPRSPPSHSPSFTTKLFHLFLPTVQHLKHFKPWNLPKQQQLTVKSAE